ncbi:MAG: DUF4013 domain-containing protein [Tahibacter sp.]
MTTEPITPFWERLREICLYPAQGSALMTIGVLAVLRLLGFVPGVGFVLNLLVSVGLYKYAFEVLRNTANGRNEPPEGSLNVDESLGRSALVLQAAFIVIGVLGYFLLGPVGGSVVMVFLALGMPGAMMSFAMDENLLLALNPVTWIRVMIRLGWPYFVVAALIFVISVLASNAQGIVVKVLPSLIGIPVFHFISNYALIGAFHLMGYLIYQYHEILGYEPQDSHTPLQSGGDPDQELLDDAAEMIRDGEISMATDMLREHVRSRGGSEGLHLQYRKLLRLSGDNAELKRHGAEYLPNLLALNKDKQAVLLVRELVELDSSFQPTNADATTRLAQGAAKAGYSELALRLINGFHKRFPNSADIPANYLLAAHLMSEKFDKDAQAIALLQQIKVAYPQHPLIVQVDALLATISAVGKALPRGA